MTIASLIVDVGMNVVGIQKEIENVDRNLSSMGRTAAKLGGYLSEAFAVGSITAFVSHVADLASEIGDTADKLGISTDAVQRFKYAAEQSGSSLDAVGTALGFMNKTLGEGGKGTIAALKDAHLSFQNIRNMKPEDAFLAIADAVQQTEDPMKQAEILTKLWGKSALDLLPAVKDGFRDTGNAATLMSKESIKNLKAAQDAWTAFGNTTVSISGNLLGAAMSVGQSITSSAKNFGQFVLTAVEHGVGFAGTMSVLKDAATNTGTAVATKLTPTIHQTAEELAEAEAAAKKHAKALEDIRLAQIPLTAAQKTSIAAWREMNVSTSNMAEALHVSESAVSKYTEGLKRNEDTAKDWIDLHRDMATMAHKLTTETIDQAHKAAEQEAHIRTTAQDQMLADLVTFHEKNQRARLSDRAAAELAVQQQADKTLAIYRSMYGESSALFKLLSDEVAEDVSHQLQQISQAAAETEATTVEATHTMSAAWERTYNELGDVSTILDAIPGKFAEIASMAARAGQAIMKNLAEGNVFGAVVAGVTAAIGIIGKLIGVGPTEYEKRMRAAVEETKKLRDELIKSHGGMTQLIADADLVGINIKEAFNWKDPEAFKNIVGELDQKTQLLNSAMEEYGFTWEDLGEKARGAKLAQLFDELYAKTDILRTAGIDYHTILERQAGDYSTLVQAAIRTGTEIPAAMQPTLQDLVDMGKLVDENGDAFKDLSDIHWAKTLTQGFDEVTGALYEIRDALIGIGGMTVHPRIQPVYDGQSSDVSGAATGGVVGMGRVLPFARGGFVPHGTDTVPAMLTPGEIILNAAQQDRVASKMDGDIVIHQTIMLDGKVVDERVERHTRRMAETGRLRTRAASGRGY